MHIELQPTYLLNKGLEGQALEENHAILIELIEQILERASQVNSKRESVVVNIRTSGGIELYKTAEAQAIERAIP